MGTEGSWAYRVEEPHGSAGWPPSATTATAGGKDHHRHPRQGAEYAALVVTDPVTEWKVNGICEQHVRVIVWAVDGTGPDNVAHGRGNLRPAGATTADAGCHSTAASKSPVWMPLPGPFGLPRER